MATARSTDCRMGLARTLEHFQTQSEMDVGPDSFDTKPSPLREVTPHLVVTTPPKPPHLCRTCGRPANSGYERCGECRIALNTEVLIKAAKTGRLLSHSPKATAKRIAGRKRHAAAIRAWKPTDQPKWLTEAVYRQEIQPRLASVKLPVLMAALGISKPYATNTSEQVSVSLILDTGSD